MIIFSSVSPLVNPPQIQFYRSGQSFRIRCKGIYGLLTEKQGQAYGYDKNLPAALRF